VYKSYTFDPTRRIWIPTDYLIEPMPINQIVVKVLSKRLKYLPSFSYFSTVFLIIYKFTPIFTIFFFLFSSNNTVIITTFLSI
jgi:hypothetical protein